MDRSSAEILALKALRWAAAEQILPRFAAHSGLEPDDLRRRAGDPELLAALLDFLLADDALAKSLCEAEGLQSHQLHKARAHLPGGGQE